MRSELSENLKRLAEELDPSSEVQVNDDSSAVVTTENGQTVKIDARDCCKFFATVGSVKSFCEAIGNTNMASIELYSVTLPDDAWLELEERFNLVEEV